MMMSAEEIKYEHRQSEGDPQIKGARRRRMRELARRRLSSDVKKADVVLVNPTHVAVALRYDSDADGAPRVLAKGKGEVAEKIREMARKAGVPILSRPPLARLIYKLVPAGAEIPAGLYKAVAEVLAYIYALRARHRGGRS
jgi:flagellar biosynthesis protein FlhB